MCFVSKKRTDVCLRINVFEFVSFFKIIISVDGSTHFSKWLQLASNQNVFVCVCGGGGGYLKPYESSPVFKYDGVDRG